MIFYSPHPDDETLTMGVLVAQHVVAGRKVHVVLFSDGRETEGSDAAGAWVADLERLGARVVERAGHPDGNVASFSKSFDDLLESLSTKAADLA